MLTGLSQKGRAIGYSLWAWGYMDSMIAGIQAGPKLPVSLAWNTVSPIRRQAPEDWEWQVTRKGSCWWSG